ncbi:MAG TPA: DNA cytosine methyltransferase [Polyangiaceae bacterium]|nr:DNA cytosine methyltransferase [Polyangiaceae bacterium]
MADSKLSALSLCSGIGGIEAGLSSIMPRSRVLGYVERDSYAASVLLARMEDETLEPAPVWCGDIESFPASQFAGRTDLVTAGFPCQPFSAAGKRERERDERHLWPAIARVIETVGPRLVFLENVQVKAFREPWRDLRAMGFEVSDPFACTAAELGAGHLRRRVFVLARHPDHQGQPQQGAAVEEGRGWDRDTARWQSEPGVDRVVHGVPAGVDRLRCLGNAVVPQQARFAFESLIAKLS